MNALATAAEPRAVPFNAAARTFDAFRIADGIAVSRNTFPIGSFTATSLKDALGEALMATSLAHKDHLLIREQSANGSIAHLYAIRRKSAPRYVHKDHVTRRLHDLYADHVCSFEWNLDR